MIFRGCIWSRSQLTDTEACADECVLASSGAYNKANIFLGLIDYELNSLLGASHLVDYISVHIRFDLERYLLNICFRFKGFSSFIALSRLTAPATSLKI